MSSDLESIAKCAHPENRELDCCWENCPKGYALGDYEDMVLKCQDKREKNWRPGFGLFEVKRMVVDKRSDLFHVLDLIRKDKWTDKEIIKGLLDLYKKRWIVFANEGTWIPYGPSKWTDEQWEQAHQQKGIFYTFLKSLYGLHFKKKELSRLRHIMRTINRRTDDHVQPEWGFFRFRREKYLR